MSEEQSSYTLNTRYMYYKKCGCAEWVKCDCAQQPIAHKSPYDTDPAYHTAASLLHGLEDINKERAGEHGGVTEEWTRTAAVWSGMLGVDIPPHVAMAMMAANKCVRLTLSPREDHFADGANYLVLGWGVFRER